MNESIEDEVTHHLEVAIVGSAGEAFSIQLIRRPKARGLPNRTAATTSRTSSLSKDKRPPLSGNRHLQER